MQPTFYHLNIRSPRSVNATVADTFTLVRLYFKPLAGMLLTVAGTAVVIVTVLSVVVIPALLDPGATTPAFVDNILWQIPTILTQAVTCAFITLLAYNPQEVPSRETVWALIKERLGTLIVATFLASLMMIIGLVFLLLPGIFIGVSLSIIPAVVVVEGLPVGKSISRAFDLTRGFWWQTFGLIIIMILILLIVMLIPAVPLVLITGFSDLLWQDYGTDTVALGIADRLLSGAGTIAGLALFTIAVTLHYFSLVEHKEAPYLRKQVEGLATPGSQFGSEQPQ